MSSLIASRGKLLVVASVGWLAIGSSALASEPTVAQALTLKPVQAGVVYARPDEKAAKDSTIHTISQGGTSGWTVRGPSGQVLRRFLDTNDDNKLDQWCYYNEGIEVYRDIDRNFNGKADEYRWLGTAGSRWGLDSDEDGAIDRWKMISPEEVSAEVISALRANDQKAFERVLLSREELSSLKLGRAVTDDLRERIGTAKQGFGDLAKGRKLVQTTSRWLQFGASRPGVIPAGTDGAERDLIIYDNVAAIVETDGKHGQVAIGTLVRLGDGWRVIDLPRKEAANGFFYASLERGEEIIEQTGGGGISAEMQELFASLEKIDKELASARTPKKLAEVNRKRADVLEELARTATDSERGTWVRSFTDAVNAAVQSGQYPEGIERLKAFHRELAKDPSAKEFLPYTHFQYMSAEYNQSLMAPNADFAKIQARWLGDLQAFVRSYPKSEETAEALLQLANAHEFAGKDSEAIRSYEKLAAEFGSAPQGRKAVGAKRRLESVGKVIELTGRSLQGRTVDLGRLRGKVVLLHYWATWCEPCKEDLKTIKALQAKFARRGFVPVGVSLDNDASTASKLVRSHSLAWPQLFAEGGLDSPLANQLGIITLPTMLLIDKSGRVVRRNIHAGELEAELTRLLK